MNATESWQALLLGIVEGLTEFLPVSSTGHLIMADYLIDFNGPPGNVFEIVIQLGAILAICWLYRATLLGAVCKAPQDRRARHFLISILIAFLPAAIIGALAHDFIKNVLFDPKVVATTLIIGGVLIMWIERIKPAPRYEDSQAFSYALAVKIGLCQVVSMIPGVSRAGATIMGALMLGVERKAAAEFSFFLAIPTMFGATLYDLYKNRDVLTAEGMEIIAIGFIAAFISAMLVVKWFVGFISRHGFVPFAWYRIAAGAAMWMLLISA